MGVPWIAEKRFGPFKPNQLAITTWSGSEATRLNKKSQLKTLFGVFDPLQNLVLHRRRLVEQLLASGQLFVDVSGVVQIGRIDSHSQQAPRTAALAHRAPTPASLAEAGLPVSAIALATCMDSSATCMT